MASVRCRFAPAGSATRARAGGLAPQKANGPEEVRRRRGVGRHRVVIAPESLRERGPPEPTARAAFPAAR